MCRSSGRIGRSSGRRRRSLALSGGTAAVAHLDDAERERLLLFVERTRGGRPAVARGLGEACRERVLVRTGLEVDEVVELGPDSLPRTSSGKVRRAELLRRYLSGRMNGS